VKGVSRLPASRPDSPRRVGVVVPPLDDLDPRTEPERPSLAEGLVDLPGRLHRAITEGSVRDDPDDGVLLDITVGRVRCLVLAQEESVAITLSPREQQVALMVAAGRTNQAIAASLEISAWTVSTHLRRIYAKLAVSSRAEMVAHLLGHADYAYRVDPTRVTSTP
jgi:DNA-binding CsgD family transcriptional regulator